MPSTAKRTRFEIIAESLPLHAQRIAEATFERGGRKHLDRLMIEPVEDGEPARVILLASFLWSRTVEGHGYWSALAADCATKEFS